MDKLKSVLSGEEARREDRTVIETVNEASSLSWATRVRGFIACFVIGGSCTILGVCMLFIPRIGLTLFIVFYTFGNICALCRCTSFVPGWTRRLLSELFNPLCCKHSSDCITLLQMCQLCIHDANLLESHIPKVPY
ncbi:vesicle transport protein SFT2B-like isoform X2 [Brachionichthys hirsutus]|uniref:vesicle transport protein SFT2B-like isoform X2 n=1 Tax=Brachionichthys hirsutus TaxID=412623 RepID=UPI00360490E9